MTHLISVNVGQPEAHEWSGKPVTTSIFKRPVSGSIAVRAHNLEGDTQSDLSVHGGPTKAVYAYPSEHYAFWRDIYPDLDWAWGMFGENLTTEGLEEDEVYIGDRFRVGSTILVATEPRIPCFKLALRLGQADVVKRFLDSQRSGIYFGIVEAGELRAGDPIERVSRDPNRVRVRDLVRCYKPATVDRELMERALRVEVLPDEWREKFVERLGKS